LGNQHESQRATRYAAKQLGADSKIRVGTATKDSTSNKTFGKQHKSQHSKQLSAASNKAFSAATNHSAQHHGSQQAAGYSALGSWQHHY
jgi:hypothetical protein